MIVVDTNVITFLFLQGAHTAKAEKALEKDPEWAAPILWKGEFRNVLAFYMRTHNLNFNDAIKVINEALHLMNNNEYDVTSLNVLKLAEMSGCSAYDCEFVALAKDLGLGLITADKQILKFIPQYTISLDDYIQ